MFQKKKLFNTVFEKQMFNTVCEKKTVYRLKKKWIQFEKKKKEGLVQVLKQKKRFTENRINLVLKKKPLIQDFERAV